MPAPTRVVVVFGLNDRERDVRLVEEEVIGLLCLAAVDGLAANDDPALGEIAFLADLRHHIPLRPSAPRIAGVMNFVRMSVSVSCFLSSIGISEPFFYPLDSGNASVVPRKSA